MCFFLSNITLLFSFFFFRKYYELYTYRYKYNKDSKPKAGYAGAEEPQLAFKLCDCSTNIQYSRDGWIMEDVYNDYVYEMFYLYIHITHSTETLLISTVYK